MAEANSTALAYVRYSPRPDAAECESLEVQEDRIRRYFDFLQVEVGHVIRDPEVSARRVPLSKRKGGAELLDLTTGHRPKFRIVGAFKLDRLFRNVIDGNLTLEAWRKSGVDFHLAAEGGQAINTSTATGRLIVNMLLSLAQFEPDQTAERTSAAMRHKQSNGYAMGGSPPFGKMFGETVDGRKTIVDNPEEMAVKSRVRYLHFDRHYSYSEIGRLLGKDGFKSRTGGNLSHTTIARICRELRPKDGHTDTANESLDKNQRR